METAYAVGKVDLDGFDADVLGPGHAEQGGSLKMMMTKNRKKMMMCFAEWLRLLLDL